MKHEGILVTFLFLFPLLENQCPGSGMWNPLLYKNEELRKGFNECLSVHLL